MNLRSFIGLLSPKLPYSQDTLPSEDFLLPEKSVLLINKDLIETKKLAIGIGSQVKSGQKIQAEDGQVLHFSSLTGKVDNIYDLQWTDGDKFVAVSIKSNEERKDEWETLFEGFDNFFEKKPEELLLLLENAGYGPDIKNITDAHAVIINCIDSDLPVVINSRILNDYKDNIRYGLKLIKHISGASKVVLAVTENNASAAKEISPDISIVKSSYPNGMKELLSRNIFNNSPDRVAVISAEVLNAIINTLETGNPYVEKIITLIAKGNKAIKNIKVRIGTPVSEILDANNIVLEENDKVIFGGFMQGKAVYNLNFPITSDTDAILIQGDENITKVNNISCVNCGECNSICPNKLQVNLLSRYSEFSRFEKCEELDIDYCIECGLCSYVCIRNRPVMQYLQFAKKEIEKLKKEDNV